MDSSRKRLARIRRLWTGSIRRRLILGISALLAIVMSVFVVDMSSRQADYLHRESQDEAQALAQTLAANSVSWVLASDLAGLQEVVQVLKGYPDVRYAMVLARDGRVLAHTDPRLSGRYARDPVSDSLLRAPLAPQLLVNTASLVDVAAPIQANGALIGWARVSLDQDRVNADLRAIARNGIIYAAIAVVLGILLAVALTRSLTRDLTRLVKAARRIGAGERGVQSDLAREDELGELSGAFDGMSSDLDRAGQALRENEQNYRSLADSASALIWASGTDKLCNYFNQPWLKFTGRTLEQELGNGWAEGVHPDDFAQCLATYTSAFDRREPFSMDYRLRRHDGEFRWIRDDGCPRYDSKGEFIGYLGYVMDITERKRAEEALQRLNRELRAISLCNQILVRAEGEQTLLNDICRIVCDEAGYRMAWVGFAEHDEARTVRPVAWAGLDSGYIADAKLTWADDTERGQGPAGKAIRSGEIFCVQDFASEPQTAPWRESALQRGYRSGIALPLKDESASVFGVLLMYSAEINPFTPDEIRLLGELSGDLAFGIVGLRTRAERKRAEQALRDSEKDLKEAQRLAQIGSWDWDTATDTITWSEEYYRIYGFDPTQRPPGYEEHLKAYTPESAARLDAAVKRNTQTGEPYELELELARTEGARRWITARSETKRDAQGRIIGLRGTAQDITERKRAEREALEQFKLAEAFFNNSVSGLVILDRNFNFVRVNEAYAKGCRREIGEFAGRNHFDMYPSDTQAIFEEVVRTKRPFITFTRAFVFADQPERGTTYWDWTLVPILDQQGEVEYLVFSLQEVTERKRVEEEERAAALYARSLIEASPDPLVTISAQGKITDVNKSTEDATGVARDRLIGTDFADYFTEPERARAGYQEVLAQGYVRDYPLTMLHRAGHTIDVLYNATVYRNEAGELSGVFAAARDVTERKRTEQKLRESEEQYRLLIMAMTEGVTLQDADSVIVAHNQSAERILGLTSDRLLGKTSFDPDWNIIHEDGSPFPGETHPVAIALKTGLPQSDVIMGVNKPDGTLTWISVNVQPTFKDGETLPSRVVATMRDITESKRADALREQLAAIVQSSHDAIIGKDLEGVVTSWNPGAEKIYGYRAEEVVGKPVSMLAPESRKHEIRDLLENVRRAEAVINFETERIRKDGTCIDISLDLSPIRDAAGRIVGASTIARDITEKKQAERVLRKVNRALKALSSCNEALIHATDEKRLLNEICRIIVDIEGYRLAWVGYVEHDAEQTVRPVAQSGYEPGYMEHAEITWADNERGRGPLGIAIRSGEIQVVQDVMTDPRFEPWRANAARLGYGSVLAAPLVADSGVIGALSIHAEGADAFDAGEIALLSELAADMAFGIVTLRTRGAHEQSAERLQRSMEATVQVIASTVEMRDPHTAGHQRRVAELATAIARELSLTEDQVHAVHLAGVVHDLGKVHIPAEILSKPGKLTAIEFELIKTHPEAGYDILKGVDFPWPIAQIVFQHHERLDGSGYPRGLKGDEIMLEARIIAVADVVEAMSSHRPYRPSLGIDAALQEISAHAGKRYDADVVRACLALFREKGFAFKA